MKNNKEKYKEKFKELYNLPQNYIAKWHYFISSELYEGYDWDSSEFINEVGIIRGKIDEILKNSDLLKFKEHKKFIQKINKLDDLFKKITIDSPYYKLDNWWENKILKYAGNYYLGKDDDAENSPLIDLMLEKYNIKIKSIKEMADDIELMEAKEKLKNFDTSFEL